MNAVVGMVCPSMGMGRARTVAIAAAEHEYLFIVK